MFTYLSIALITLAVIIRGAYMVIHYRRLHAPILKIMLWSAGIFVGAEGVMFLIFLGLSVIPQWQALIADNALIGIVVRCMISSVIYTLGISVFLKMRPHYSDTYPTAQAAAAGYVGAYVTACMAFAVCSWLVIQPFRQVMMDISFAPFKEAYWNAILWVCTYLVDNALYIQLSFQVVAGKLRIGVVIAALIQFVYLSVTLILADRIPAPYVVLLAVASAFAALTYMYSMHKHYRRRVSFRNSSFATASDSRDKEVPF